MLDKLVIIFFLSFLLITYNCQQNTKNQDKTMNNISNTNNERLIDGIKIDNSIFAKNDIDLKKYQFKNQYIEDLQIKDLLDKNYRAEFIQYLKKIKVEDDEFKSTLISQLLIIRMIQLNDGNAFNILSILSKDDLIADNGIELYLDTLSKFFIENPLFFIKQGSKYHDNTILNSLSRNLDEYLVQQNFFKDNLGEINLKTGQIFLFPEKEKEFTNRYREKISKFKKEECIFSPTLYTAWQNKTIDFTDISPQFEDELVTNLNLAEKNYFNLYIKNILKKYTVLSIATNNMSLATIEDPDGYTNLRKDKNTTSEVLQKIKSGEQIEVLDSSGDWWLIQTKENKKGYVHKSRVK